MGYIYGILTNMAAPDPEYFHRLYQQFEAPVTASDCGQKCAPHNSRGVPFCCDTHHALPAVYDVEWTYLQDSTDLWHLWEPKDPSLSTKIQAELPYGMKLVACLGHQYCQRGYRAITCRAFPFFPYLDRKGVFLGLATYWEYEDRCWVVSNLDRVTPEYRQQFILAFESLFTAFPDEQETFRQYSIRMRRAFGQRKRAITLLHRNGGDYKITPHNGRMRRVIPGNLSQFDPYKIIAQLPFTDEIE